MKVPSIDDEQKRTTLYVRGFSAGLAAWAQKTSSLSAYLRTGIDEYAQGYPSGYYYRKAFVGHSPHR